MYQLIADLKRDKENRHWQITAVVLALFFGAISIVQPSVDVFFKN